MTEKIVVFSTCGSEEEAAKVGRALVEARVAACVNIVPKIRSIYRWKGEVQDDSEWLLVIKSSRPLFDRLKAELRRVHSYEVPELLAIPVVDGSPEYLDWLNRELLGSDTLL
jgi:periplasmic divalent cation tolerance protein